MRFWFDESAGPVAALTPLRNHEMPDDIRARLAGRQIYQFDPWASLGSLFEASSIDARLRYGEGADAFASALLRASGGNPFAPVTGGFLDPDTAWNAFLRRGLNQNPPAVELSEWLLWAAQTPAGVRSLFDDYADVVPALRERMTENTGDPGAFMLGILAQAVSDDVPNPGVHALAVGLALDAAFRAEDAGHVKAATRVQTRLEGEAVIGSAAMHGFAGATRTAWTLLSESADRNGGAGLAKNLRHAVDELLADVAGNEARILAEQSIVSATGWDERIRRFAEALEDVLDTGSSATGALNEALDNLETHSEADRYPQRLELFRSVARLAYRLTQQDPADVTLGELAEQYVRDGSFIDALREQLTAADPGPIASPAVDRVVEHALERSDRINERFAELLAVDLRNRRGPSAGLPIHHALGRAIAPIAAEHPVLVVVLDGLNWAVARWLLMDDALDQWDPWIPGQDDAVEAMFATVPSVTKHSRTSLLTGKLQPGNQRTERDVFARALRDAGGISRLKDAELFHKADVDAAGRGFVGSDIEQAITDPEKRVVGVVVNAIDDQLDGADQVALEWSVDAVTPLRTLLKLASQRVVVIVGDHGHVWETKTERTIGAASARWRPIGEDLVDGERVFSGPMIQELTGEPEIVAAWSEKLRYTRGRRGYHGGASIQEIVTPLVVLSRGTVELDDAGFTRLRTIPPSWWDLQEPPKTAEVAEPASDEPQLDLLSQASDVDTAWIRRLMEADRFQDRLDKFGEGIDADLVGRVLAQFEANGHRLSEKELAGLLGRTIRRSRGILMVLKDVLNREGYLVLHQDRRERMLKLDRPLLEQQFGLRG